MALPSKPKGHTSQKNILIGCGVCGTAAFIILVITMAFPIPTTTFEHSILVDPTKEKQSLFVLARVTIQNTGNQPITNIIVDYGDGDKDFIPTLKSGKKVAVKVQRPNIKETIDFFLFDRSENSALSLYCSFSFVVRSRKLCIVLQTN